MSYLPVKYKGEWRPTYLLGTGSYSKVWKVCRNSDCGFVMKEIMFSDVYTLKRFNKEVKMQKRCANVGLCPKIIDYISSDQGGVIIMKRLDTTVLDIIKEFEWSDKVQDLIEGDISDLFDRLWNSRIIHGDPHKLNIMATYNKQVKKKRDESFVDFYKRKDYKYKFIDMGRAYTSPPGETGEMARLEDWQMFKKE